MKILIDTHVLLWIVDSASCHLVPSPARDLVTDTGNDLLVSAITPWELSLKHWLGKLPEAGALLDTWDQTINRLRATILPLSDRHGIVAGRLEWSHKDPFDRMIAAQAILENAVLISADAAFGDVPGLRRSWQ